MASRCESNSSRIIPGRERLSVSWLVPLPFWDWCHRGGEPLLAVFVDQSQPPFFSHQRVGRLARNAVWGFE